MNTVNVSNLIEGKQMNNLHVITATAHEGRVALSPEFGWYKVCLMEW